MALHALDQDQRAVALGAARGRRRAGRPRPRPRRSRAGWPFRRRGGAGSAGSRRRAPRRRSRAGRGARRRRARAACRGRAGSRPSGAAALFDSSPGPATIASASRGQLGQRGDRRLGEAAVAVAGVADDHRLGHGDAERRRRWRRGRRSGACPRRRASRRGRRAAPRRGHRAMPAMIRIWPWLSLSPPATGGSGWRVERGAGRARVGALIATRSSCRARRSWACPAPPSARRGSTAPASARTAPSRWASKS